MTSSLEYLLQRYADKACTPEEREQLMQLLRQADNDDQVKQWLDLAIAGREVRYTMPDDAATAVLQAIFQSAERPVAPIQPKTPVRILLARRMAVAAVLLLLLGAGFIWFSRNRVAGPAKTAGAGQAVKSDISPGGNKAILTLANGSSIVLDSAANGMLAQQGNATVIKKSDGQLAYNTLHEKPTEVLYNTLATPRGGQYQLVLPDGSKVWLNAASSIHYPTAFVSGERRVDITGEAYFEVARNMTKPFIVKVGSPEGSKGMVKVLGTNFNVNAYDDEPVARTTLLEGAVKVTKDAASAVLEPGQQAELERAGDIRLVRGADLDQVMAWKNGLFSFKGADIRTVMRQVQRWYDVEVSFEGEIPEKFHVEMSRNTNVSNVFRILETTGGVHFKIDGKKISVTR
jgi:transmembrane sensor